MRIIPIWSERPITTLYSNDPDRRTTVSTALRTGHSTTIDRGVAAAFNKVNTRQWKRADVYNRFGTHIRSIVRYPHRGIAVEDINVPLHMNSDKQKPNHVAQGNPGPRKNVLIPYRQWGRSTI